MTTYEKQKSSKSDDFEDFWSVLTKKMQEQSLVSQGFAGFWGSIFRFCNSNPQHFVMTDEWFVNVRVNL